MISQIEELVEDYRPIQAEKEKKDNEKKLAREKKKGQMGLAGSKVAAKKPDGDEGSTEVDRKCSREGNESVESEERRTSVAEEEVELSGEIEEGEGEGKGTKAITEITIEESDDEDQVTAAGVHTIRSKKLPEKYTPPPTPRLLASRGRETGHSNNALPSTLPAHRLPTPADSSREPPFPTRQSSEDIPQTSLPSPSFGVPEVSSGQEQVTDPGGFAYPVEPAPSPPSKRRIKLRRSGEKGK
jgi:hypothetical protein